MTGAAPPYGAGEFDAPRTRVRQPRTKVMTRHAAWQPVPLTAAELPDHRTDHGPFADERGRPLRLAADPAGLAVVGGTADVEWQHVTRFVCRAYASRRAGRGLRYTLSAGRASISWDVPATADAALRAEHERLCRLVVSRTGLPLIEEGVVAPAWPVQVRGGRAVPLPDEAVVTTPPSRVRPPRRQGRSQAGRGFWRGLGLVFVLLALAAAVAYGAMTLLAQGGIQPPSPSALASKVQASDTTYFDALNLNDGDWPAGVLPGSGATASFRDHAYVLAAKGRAAVALAPGALGAGAPEVTVASHQGVGGAGLALRASSDGSALLVFAVTPDGHWLLALSDAATSANAPSPTLRDLAGGVSGVIQRGAAASNTLFIIPQSARYLCYVNGHYLATVTLHPADASALPAIGSAGLWVAPDTAASFTAFAVYPQP